MNPADGESPVFSAAEALRERWGVAHAPRVRPPRTVILCYQPTLIAYARRAYALRRVDGFFGEVYLLKASGGRVAISGNFGLGAPAAVIQLEELAAFGVRRFLSLGAAGSLQTGASPGDWLVCTRALRDEGTSGHYAGSAAFRLRSQVEHASPLVLEPGGKSASRPTPGPRLRVRFPERALPWAPADPELTAFLQSSLASQGPSLQSGAVWTTDAPYRETRAGVAAAQKLGICAVDMEIAALFAAGLALGAQVGAALVLADRVSPEGWRPPPDGVLVRNSLRRLLDVVVAGLIREGQAQ